MKIIMTKGLPGSGKSTWAKKYQSKNPNTVRVNKDELRVMLHNGKHSKARESFVLKIRDTIIENALEERQDVIVDDTNLNPIHEERIRYIAMQYQAEVEIQDFTMVPIDKCIKNDLQRLNSVGSRVIWDQYNQWLKPKPEPAPEYNELLPNCIICDLDGTLALFGDANPYDRDFSKDQLNNVVDDLIRGVMTGVRLKLIIVSGRNGKFEGVTRQWLDDMGVKFSELYMREAEDIRKDSVVKKEIYDKFIRGKYNVQFVLDDRNQVVQLWRSLGLTCLQVADGNF